MRIKSFQIKSVGPIAQVHVVDLADVVVFAGPNGVGKTSIISALLNLARQPNASNDIWMVVEATNAQESSRWGKPILDTRVQADANLLAQTLHRSRRRNQYHGAFLNFDSDRAVRNVQSYQFQWDIGNPLTEEIGWDVGWNTLFSRYNEVRHTLFRMVEGQKREIADKAFTLKDTGQGTMPLDFPDVLKPFKDAFWQLLAPKKLVEVNTRDQQIYYDFNGSKLSFETLSSGEKEVTNIVFDFLLRDPADCVVVFDEPELHLHPELSYKLLQTLAGIGQRNQFLFSTHSPEIISASLENTVVFVTPPQSPDVNQAVVVHRDDQTHHALQTLGQSIGVISLGKRIVLVEGEEASLDKQTYGAILRNRFPEFVLVPAGGKDAIRSFADVRDNILNRTIWGVGFYLLCDRDAANVLGANSVANAQSGRIKLLPRYHLENYFLDPVVLAQCFASMEPADSWLRNSTSIKAKILEFAHSVISYAVALNVTAAMRERVSNISVMPKGAMEAKSADELISLMSTKLVAEQKRVSDGLDDTLLRSLVQSEYARLTKSIDDDSEVWLRDLPGRIILHKFAAAAGIQAGRLKQLYLTNANTDTAFADIVAIFEQFRAT
jgi:energy-coupling factor transporter ATP-binding protein EcfA2